MSVSLVKTLHIHVDCNTPGYLPEDEPMCFMSATASLAMLKCDIKDYQDLMYDMCEYEEEDWDNCECPWCEVARDCESAICSIADGDAAHYLATGGVTFKFWPPEGPNIVFWAEMIRSPWCKCEFNDDNL